MDCILCGLPTPLPPIKDGETAFCCVGCREVYRCFGEEILTASTVEQSALEATPPDGNEAFLKIDGMHCSSCEILIERTAARIDGILAVASSYATSTVKIIYDPDKIDEARLPELLSVTGYKASLRADHDMELEDNMSLLRVIAATSIAAVIMMLYLAFYYPTHIGLVDYADLEPVGWLAFKAAPYSMFFLTTVLIIYAGLPIFRGALIGLRVGMLNMDNLLSIAVLAAYSYSTVQLFAGSRDLYFDVATAIVTVVTIGRYFERNARTGAAFELSKLLEKWTPTARIHKNGVFDQCSINDLKPGEHIFVRPGEPIPIDGMIADGEAAVDESLMTGEPFPIRRSKGDPVQGGTTVIEGSIVVEAGQSIESQMGTLARILWDVQSSTSGMRGIADRIARIFVPAVLGLALLVSGLSLLAGTSVSDALLTGLATLIVSCPCAFGLAVPLATAAGISHGLRNGLILTSADIFEKPPRFDIVAIDKTGTLSTGNMVVNGVIGSALVSEYAAAVERLSSHPIAKAIAKLDRQYAASEIEIHPGRGAIARVEGKQVAVGSRLLFESRGLSIPEQLAKAALSKTPDEGVVSYVGWDAKVQGAIITCDESRNNWQQVIEQLEHHSRVILLTGAEHPGAYQQQVDEVFAGVPPEAKAAVIKGLKSEGSVVMIGDGSNDAPALAQADLGIAFGAPSSLAADAADVVIPGNRLEKIFDAFNVIEITRRRIRQNLGWALLYNATAIPLAVSGSLNPLFAALAMSTSSLLVVWNSSRPIAKGGSDDAMIRQDRTEQTANGQSA